MVTKDTFIGTSHVVSSSQTTSALTEHSPYNQNIGNADAHNFGGFNAYSQRQTDMLGMGSNIQNAVPSTYDMAPTNADQYAFGDDTRRNVYTQQRHATVHAISETSSQNLRGTPDYRQPIPFFDPCGDSRALSQPRVYAATHVDTPADPSVFTSGRNQYSMQHGRQLSDNSTAQNQSNLYYGSSSTYRPSTNFGETNAYNQQQIVPAGSTGGHNAMVYRPETYYVTVNDFHTETQQQYPTFAGVAHSATGCSNHDNGTTTPYDQIHSITSSGIYNRDNNVAGQSDLNNENDLWCVMTPGMQNRTTRYA